MSHNKQNILLDKIEAKYSPLINRFGLNDIDVAHSYSIWNGSNVSREKEIERIHLKSPSNPIIKSICL